MPKPKTPPKSYGAAVIEIDQLRRKLKRQERTIRRQAGLIDTANGRLGSTLRDLSETMKERDHLRHALLEQAAELNDTRILSRIRGAQVDALVMHAIALAQRYAGVKLDCQQFTFAQAQEWLASERSTIFGTLERIDHEQRQPQNMAASQQREAA